MFVALLKCDVYALKWYTKLICCFKVLLRGRQSCAKAVMVKPFLGHSCFYR